MQVMGVLMGIDLSMGNARKSLSSFSSASVVALELC